MTTNIDELSSAELNALKAKIDLRIAELHKESIRDALAEMHNIASSYDLAFDEVISSYLKKRRRPFSRSSPKYVNPEDPSQTWSGRGRKPAWFNSALETGRSIEDLTA